MQRYCQIDKHLQVTEQHNRINELNPNFWKMGWWLVEQAYVLC